MPSTIASQQRPDRMSKVPSARATYESRIFVQSHPATTTEPGQVALTLNPDPRPTTESSIEHVEQSLTHAMTSESRDTRWSTRAEGQIIDAFAAMPDTDVDVDVECRMTLCELSVDAHTLVDRDDMLERLPRAVPWRGQGFFKFETSESTVGTFFIAREGETLF